MKAKKTFFIQNPQVEYGSSRILSSVCYWIYPVVIFRFMTSHDTAAAVCLLCENHREHPPALAKGNLLADMFGLIAGMHLMAGDTGPSFLPVDVKEVQVLLAVPEAGAGCGKHVESDITAVTVEADGVVSGGIGRIKFSRKRFYQDVGVIGTVAFVAGVAVIL
jgi:hypothetical protein